MVADAVVNGAGGRAGAGAVGDGLGGLWTVGRDVVQPQTTHAAANRNARPTTGK